MSGSVYLFINNILYIENTLRSSNKRITSKVKTVTSFLHTIRSNYVVLETDGKSFDS